MSGEKFDVTSPPNHTANDLWQQVFERAAAQPGAAIVDPHHGYANAEVNMRAGLATAGWNQSEIEAISRMATERRTNAPTTSPGVNRDAEAIYAKLCDDIEAEMARQGLDSHLRIARGIEPSTGPSAAKIGVMMTDQSIVTVGTFTFRFCGLIARAFVRTLYLHRWLWESAHYTEQLGIDALHQEPELAAYWAQIFISFAISGTNNSVPYIPSKRNEVVLFEQVARSMELFMVGHEYGHHHLKHGKSVGGDQHEEEFAADQFSLRMIRRIGEDERPMINPFVSSGAGGVILLKALDTLRHCEYELGSQAPLEATHPTATTRIARFDSVAVLNPTTFQTLKGFRLASGRIMDLAGKLMFEFFEGISKEDRNQLTIERSKHLKYEAY